MRKERKEPPGVTGARARAHCAGRVAVATHTVSSSFRAVSHARAAPRRASDSLSVSPATDRFAPSCEGGAAFITEESRGGMIFEKPSDPSGDGRRGGPRGMMYHHPSPTGSLPLSPAYPLDALVLSRGRGRERPAVLDA